MSRIPAHSAGSIGLPLVILLAALTALDVMAIDMYLPSMPALAIDFGVEAGRIQQTFSVFLVGLAVGQGLYGPLLDRFGRRLPLLAGVCIFILGSWLAALAPSVEWLLGARFLQALGAAAGLVAPRAIVADLCNLSESSRIFSLLMQVMMIAPIVAPLLGSYLLDHGGWRLIFWVLCGVGLICLIWSARSIPDSLPPENRLPLQAMSILRAYTRQARSPAFMLNTLIGGIILGSFFAYISASAFVFTRHFSLSPEQFSYLFAANSLALVVGGYLSNRLLKAGMQIQRVMLLGVVLHTLGGALLALVVIRHAPSLALYASLLALGIGALGLVFGNVTALTMNAAGQQVGVASALMGVLHYLLAAIIGYLVSLSAEGPLQLPLVMALCGLLALATCWLASSVTERP
ncbi:multidrug effflux MFS transporter [Pseudomonas sp. ABC1]|uniref:multidrug effflux MFS transporter n=1 Tax=Pseudomonas sp. ABC1 TaxID=2748080 RepID=UPI0015C33DC9|nr:multidrug effflux MFS transporter [Pseudomonas sp. ABC1]QLF93403.1 multidrug effflux MFS transporter [Pseudomonas sp. ABC1]